VKDEDLDEWREALRARVDSCWARLMDVVSELHMVHHVPTEEIVKRIEDAAPVGGEWDE